jgi:hypothetical protein
VANRQDPSRGWDRRCQASLALSPGGIIFPENAALRLALDTFPSVSCQLPTLTSTPPRTLFARNHINWQASSLLTEPRNFRRILLLFVIGRQQCDTRDTRHISYIRPGRQLMCLIHVRWGFLKVGMRQLHDSVLKLQPYAKRDVATLVFSVLSPGASSAVSLLRPCSAFRQPWFDQSQVEHYSCARDLPCHQRIHG